MLLQNKNAVIYGAGGSLGSAMAKAFAGQGATVYVTGNKLPVLKQLANDIINGGGKAVAMQVDALEERQVNDCIVAAALFAGG